ncbi:MAG: alanine racemase [Steroidobacteraceae bacterium]
MSRLIRAVIDAGALRHNLEVIRARAPGARVMAVVKANAYGHGLVQTALALKTADAFAVARLEEGVRLREQGMQAPIVLLEGVFSLEQLREARHHRLELVVHDARQIQLLAAADGPQREALWIKIDTGMNRLGFRPEAFRAAYEQVRALQAAACEIRLMTHLAAADVANGQMTREQLERFALATHGVPGEHSIANSAGIFGAVAVGGQWVRPGLALYGASPLPERTAAELGLRPVMRLETSVIAMRHVPRGETVGYGATWRAERDTRLAIVAAGYGDGLPRSLPSGTPVCVAGQRVPLVGRVSMDMIAVDVTAIEGVSVGTPTLLWGAPELAVEEVAGWAGTIAYELLCSVSERVPLELR